MPIDAPRSAVDVGSRFAAMEKISNSNFRIRKRLANSLSVARLENSKCPAHLDSESLSQTIPTKLSLLVLAKPHAEWYGPFHERCCDFRNRRVFLILHPADRPLKKAAGYSFGLIIASPDREGRWLARWPQYVTSDGRVPQAEKPEISGNPGQQAYGKIAGEGAFHAPRFSTLCLRPGLACHPQGANFT